MVVFVRVYSETKMGSTVLLRTIIAAIVKVPLKINIVFSFSILKLQAIHRIVNSFPSCFIVTSSLQRFLIMTNISYLTKIHLVFPFSNLKLQAIHRLISSFPNWFTVTSTLQRFLIMTNIS